MYARLGFTPWLCSPYWPWEGLGIAGALLQLWHGHCTSFRLCHPLFGVIRGWWCGQCGRASLLRSTSPRPPGMVVPCWLNTGFPGQPLQAHGSIYPGPAFTQHPIPGLSHP